MDYLLALNEGLAVLVELELGDLQLGGVDRNGHLLAVALVHDDAVNVDAIAATVNRGNLMPQQVLHQCIFKEL